MFVHRLLADARERLVVVDARASPFLEAATPLQSGTDLVVVCGPDGAVADWLGSGEGSRSDFGHAQTEVRS
jgi:hypothetical protein